MFFAVSPAQRKCTSFLGCTITTNSRTVVLQLSCLQFAFQHHMVHAINAYLRSVGIEHHRDKVKNFGTRVRQVPNSNLYVSHSLITVFIIARLIS